MLGSSCITNPDTLVRTLSIPPKTGLEGGLGAVRIRPEYLLMTLTGTSILDKDDTTTTGRASIDMDKDMGKFALFYRLARGVFL
jgi:hypothetical protein